MTDIVPDDLNCPEFPVKSAALCVDLDGTLLKTNSLLECFIKALKVRPFTLLLLPYWLGKGRYYLKQALTEQAGVGIDLMNCPRNNEVEHLIAEARERGKKVELVTAAHHELIALDPEFCAMFDAVIASRDGVNLKAEAKADLLRKRHPNGFAYVGNSVADLPVWRAATERFGVNIPHAVRKQATSEGLDLVELSNTNNVALALLKSLRLHQWVKNLLVFVPLALILTQLNRELVFNFLTAFLLLGLLTSGTYQLNDIMDIEADRRHPRKRRRPIASGELPLLVAALVGVFLTGAAIVGAFFLNVTFGWVLVAYLIITLGYSLILKQVPLIDILIIAGLFTLRIVAGMTLIGAPPSEWLLMFAIFFFLSLAMMKRVVEMNVLDQNGTKILAGRGYQIDDRIFGITFGISSGVASLVIFALFVSAMINSPSGHYATPKLLWGIMPALSYWLMSMWLMTTRGVMSDDPIRYAITDRVSWIVAFVVSALAIAAQLVDLYP